MSDFRLRVFAAAARTLNFKQAADELCISQPAVSKHIKALEETYQVRLFERRASTLSLTPAGLLLQRRCRDLLAAYDQIAADLAEFKQKTAGLLRLGASTTIAQYLLPEILASFCAAFPQVQVTLTAGNTRAVEQALRAQDIELGFVEGVYRSAGLIYTPFKDDELCLIASKDTAAALPPVIAPAALPSLPLVLREQGSGTLDVIRSYLQAQHLKLSDLQVKLYLGTTEGIKRYLLKSSCLAIVSRLAVERELRSGELVALPMEHGQLKRRLHIVELPGPRSPSAERLRAAVLHSQNSTEQ